MEVESLPDPVGDGLLLGGLCVAGVQSAVEITVVSAAHNLRYARTWLYNPQALVPRSCR